MAEQNQQIIEPGKTPKWAWYTFGVVVILVVGILLHSEFQSPTTTMVGVADTTIVPAAVKQDVAPVVSIPYAPWYADEPGTIVISRNSQVTLIPVPGKWSVAWVRVIEDAGCNILPKDSCRVRFSAKDQKGFLIRNGVKTEFGPASRLFQVFAWSPTNLVGY